MAMSWDALPPYKKISLYGMKKSEIEELIYNNRVEGYVLVYLNVDAAHAVFEKRKKAGAGPRFLWTDRDDKELAELMKNYPNASFIELSARFIPERTPKALYTRAKVLGIESEKRRAY